METTISAVFESRVNARDAISELCGFGLKASDISVAELEIGVGVMFGTAQTLSPGRGSVDISTIVQPNYPQWAGGGMPAGMVATTSEDVLASLMDFGLSEEAAAAVEGAIGSGSVLLAVTVEDGVSKTVEGMMGRHDGRVLAADG